MADAYHTLGTRFAKSKFFAKNHRFQSINPSLPVSGPENTPFLDEHIAELMETLRLHINAVLRLPLPVQKRSRLVRNYWELEYLVKEIRLLTGPEPCLSSNTNKSPEVPPTGCKGGSTQA